MIASLSRLLFVLFLITLPGFSGKDRPEPDFKIISFEEFERLTAKESEKLRIFNFWATWCAPCVREMPYFDHANKSNTDMELYFISMDDARRPERVSSFIEKRDIQSPVYLLNDVDFNSWIDKVNPDWTGAIPATLFVKADGSRHFHEGEMEEPELLKLIDQLK
ncbi:TlpA family protein disulfide reductase [Cyclobacterium jeungdonense]|uniref:TlpA family protein disulfide reductase n=1 Tax=Cyclobacterium jeungdonense TaxID=708087 RepID=A0ABT8C7Q8_9BACT|nr:TlpA family protein disulfide reductase [Cyclobacterium jeungdonense]MDN3688092.1 TlpA family protein disulfide reductase [Cyclobacterium jeungdonense]